MYKEVVIAIAEYLIYVLPIIALGAWLRSSKTDKYLMVWRAILAVSIGFFIAFIAGQLFYNPRPFASGQIEPFFYHEADNGFPSSHMLMAALIAGVVYVSSRKSGICLMILAALVGIGRVLGHVHSWIDIIAANLIAVVAIVVAQWIIGRLPNKILMFGHYDRKDA